MKQLLIKIWENSLIKKIYHKITPRIRITKKFFGLKYKININDHLQFFLVPASIQEEGCNIIMSQKWGVVWDVGCNFGLFSILSAYHGNRVYSFDLSNKALRLVEKSAKLNNLEVETIHSPMTVNKISYRDPETSDCTNSLVEADGETGLQSITYLEAAKKYAMPDLIKMDIEGGEREFFNSKAFIDWINKNRISILLEIHDGYYPDIKKIKGAKIENLDTRHVFIVMI